MPSREQLNWLRGEVHRAELNAGRKVSRLARVNHVDVARLGLDPRRTKQRVARYTVPQLESYLASLKGFTSRTNQVYADAQGNPISAEAWKEYKLYERRVARQTQAFYNTYKDLQLPMGETVKDRMARTYTGRFMQSAVNAPYDPPNFKVQDIASARALKKLTETAKKRSGKDHIKQRVEMGKNEFRQMMEVLKDPELEAEVAKLTDAQFAGLWFYTNFANSISMSYAMLMHMLTDRETAAHNEHIETAARDARNYVRHAQRWKLDIDQDHLDELNRRASQKK